MLAGVAQLPAGGEVFGPAFTRDGGSVQLAAGGQLLRFHPRTLAPLGARPLGKTPRLGGPAVVLRARPGSDAAVELATAAQVVVEAPPGYQCGEPAFSADASRLSRSCIIGGTEDRVIVQDARTGAVIAELAEFHTAAPVRAGAITESGRFVFWWSRASGAFEEIASKVVGPTLSSRAVMAPDERVVFTVTDKDWMPDDRTPAQVLDAGSGQVRYTLPLDIDRVYFSPDSRRFVAIHVGVGEDRKVTDVTVHRTGDGVVVARLPDREVELAAFSPDAREVVIRGGGAMRLYSGIP
jgi:hypothetical protein